MSASEVTRVTSTLSQRYRVLTELGVGGMAHVYLAMSQGLAGFNKLVVLKVLKRDLANLPGLREGFLREARLSARMGHPNVVAVNAVEEHDGVPVIVMEYLQGQTLSTIQRRLEGKVPLEFHLRILCDSLRGLHYVHELADFDGKKLNLVHRDFTPQNIFVTFDGAVKVLDFGIAQVTRNPTPAKKEIIKGKLRYMAPEQIIGAPMDRRSDLFAAGVMLSEAVLGKRLWGELPESDVVKRIVTGSIPTVRSIDPNCPVALDAICRKALATDPNQRYATAAELLEALQVYITEQQKGVSAQELGDRLAVWFDAERQAAQQIIESRLGDESFVSWSSISVAHYEVTRSNTPPVAMTQTVSSESEAAQSSSSAVLRHGRRKMVKAAWILGAAMTCILAWVVARNRAITDNGQHSIPSLASGRKSATIRISAIPSTAQLILDDVTQIQNPFVKEVAAEESWHQVRAQAPGYRTVEQRFQFNRDIELVLALEADRSVVTAASTPTSAAPSNSTAVSPAPIAALRKPTTPASPKQANRQSSRARSSCSPPFTIDVHGLKRFKPECM